MSKVSHQTKISIRNCLSSESISVFLGGSFWEIFWGFGQIVQANAQNNLVQGCALILDEQHMHSWIIARHMFYNSAAPLLICGWLVWFSPARKSNFWFRISHCSTSPFIAKRSLVVSVNSTNTDDSQFLPQQEDAAIRKLRYHYFMKFPMTFLG